jgi:hypothetical protein
MTKIQTTVRLTTDEYEKVKAFAADQADKGGINLSYSEAMRVLILAGLRERGRKR